MPFGADIFYKSHISIKNAARPSIILIHGAGGSHLSWPPLMRRMPDYSIYAIDLPGHGHSVDRQIDSIEDYYQLVRKWKEALSIGPVILVGHSMGSAIAMKWALNEPDIITAMILIGSSAHLKVNPGLLISLCNPETYSQSVDKIIRWSFSKHTHDKLKFMIGKRMVESRSEVLYRDFLICHKFNVSKQLNKINIPTLVVCGELDRMTPLPESTSLVQSLPSAHLEIVAGAGHMVMLEKPTETLTVIQRFLDQIEPEKLS